MTHNQLDDGHYYAKILEQRWSMLYRAIAVLAWLIGTVLLGWSAPTIWQMAGFPIELVLAGLACLLLASLIAVLAIPGSKRWLAFGTEILGSGLAALFFCTWQWGNPEGVRVGIAVLTGVCISSLLLSASRANSVGLALSSAGLVLLPALLFFAPSLWSARVNAREAGRSKARIAQVFHSSNAAAGTAILSDERLHLVAVDGLHHTLRMKGSANAWCLHGEDAFGNFFLRSPRCSEAVEPVRTLLLSPEGEFLPHESDGIELVRSDIKSGYASPDGNYLFSYETEKVKAPVEEDEGDFFVFEPEPKGYIVIKGGDNKVSAKFEPAMFDASMAWGSDSLCGTRLQVSEPHFWRIDLNSMELTTKSLELGGLLSDTTVGYSQGYARNSSNPAEHYIFSPETQEIRKLPDLPVNRSLTKITIVGKDQVAFILSGKTQTFLYLKGQEYVYTRDLTHGMYVQNFTFSPDGAKVMFIMEATGQNALGWQNPVHAIVDDIRDGRSRRVWSANKQEGEDLWQCFFSKDGRTALLPVNEYRYDRRFRSTFLGSVTYAVQLESPNHESQEDGTAQ